MSRSVPSQLHSPLGLIEESRDGSIGLDLKLAKLAPKMPLSEDARGPLGDHPKRVFGTSRSNAISYGAPKALHGKHRPFGASIPGGRADGHR